LKLRTLNPFYRKKFTLPILPNGKKIKLKKSQIFDEGEKKGWHYKVFAIPGVQNNCVVEYQYSLTTNHISLLDPWYFQSDIHTDLSRFSIKIPTGFMYNSYMKNSPILAYKPTKELYEKPEQIRKKYAKYTWEFRDLPAIKDEPYMTTMKDYVAALNFQLIEYKDPYVYYTFVKTWDDLNEKIYPNYRPYLKHNRTVNTLADQIVGHERSYNKKMELLYNFVRDSIETKGYKPVSGWKNDEPKTIIKNKSGSRIEKNLLLIALLRASGIDADPVLISTRAHGRVDKRNPRLDSYNRLLVLTENHQGKLLLDTGNPYCPYGLLPPEDYTDIALVINQDTPQFIDIPKPKTVSMVYAKTIEAELNEEGTLTVKAFIRYEGFRNMIYRNKLATSEHEKDFIKHQVINRIQNVNLDTFEIDEGVEKTDPLLIKVEFSVESFAEVAGDKIYFSPVLFHRLRENIFQLENRTYPIDYNYPRMDEEEINIKLPEGYMVDELPEPLELGIDGQQFERHVTIHDKSLTYKRRLYVNKTFFSPKEYKRLKEFYSFIVQSDQDQVVLTTD